MVSLVEKVKNVLIFNRTASDVCKEILELKEVKAAYSHFLSSWEGQQDTVLSQYISHNLMIIKISLQNLYTELEGSKAEIRQVMKAEEPNEPQWNIYKPSAQEEKAVMAFNADKRFSITE